jgi:hypothetical protein
LARLPLEPEGRIVLNGTTCPCPPAEVATTNLKVLAWPLGHDYGDSSRYDMVEFFADKPTYRRLGLLLLASIFHPNRQIVLHLLHPETKVLKLRMGCGTPDPSSADLRGLAMVPSAYGYEAAPVGHLHPLWREEWRIEGIMEKYSGRSAWPLPQLCLTNECGRCGSESDFANRNIVDGFGGSEETTTLASLLLDIGLPQTELTEFCLESPSGNWSVSIGSAEARFWIGYDYDY